MDIYIVKINDIDDLKLLQLSSTISKQKRERFIKYYHKIDKIRLVIGEILAKTIIIEQTNLLNNQIQFDINEYGKPSLLNNPSVHFNISHSNEYVCCAFSNNCIGIDVEFINDIEYESIANTYFTKDENNYISNSANKLDTFYQLWTLKESYIKCIGKGLSIPFSSFSIDFNNLQINLKDNKEYLFKTIDFDSNYKLSICSKSNCTSPDLIFINQIDLLNYYDSVK